MDDLALAPRAQRETTSLEQLKHGSIFRQHLCDQRPEPACTGYPSEMTDKHPANATPLMLVDHDKGDLGLPGLDDN
jgi:hypothetical protein